MREAKKTRLVLSGGQEQRKNQIDKIWNRLYYKDPQSLTGRAYIELSEEQREAVLTRVVNAMSR